MLGFLFLGLWLLLSPAIAPGAAQQSAGSDVSHTTSTRTIEGLVLTSSGAIVAGAIVLLKDNKTLQVRSYIVQADGSYHFFGLSTEVNYTLRAETRELTSKQKTVSVFDSKPVVTLNLKLTKNIKSDKK